MSETFFEKLGAIFARDKKAYWWNLLTDYERSLSRMSLSELASELDRAKIYGETANTIIVEHMLAARLARIQSRASWWSGWLGFLGAMLAAGLTFYLGQLSAGNPSKVACPVTQAVVTPIQDKLPTNQSSSHADATSKP